jgi:uncharacterized protein YegP (UPF0339 family)
MATAAKTTRVTKVEPAPAMTLAVYENNGGRFHWRLLAGNGRALATSDDSFSSARDAERSASDVRDAARSVAIG